jgi:hypothetical protein
MAALALKLGQGAEVGSPAKEGYIPRGLRVNFFSEERGAKRAVDMLIKKINGEAFETEYPMPVFDRVQPSAPIRDLSHAKIAIVTSGGIVPKGNPDRIESSSASKFGKYNFAGVVDLTAQTSETALGGYDPVYANEDADREVHEFTYSLYPHEGGWRSAGTVKMAYSLNCPVSARVEGAHPGSLPRNLSMVSVDQDNVVTEVVKKAEDSDHTIVRLYECHNRRTQAVLSCGRTITEAFECNLMEENQQALEVKNNQLAFTLLPYEIKTFKVKI